MYMSCSPCSKRGTCAPMRPWPTLDCSANIERINCLERWTLPASCSLMPALHLAAAQMNHRQPACTSQVCCASHCRLPIGTAHTHTHTHTHTRLGQRMSVFCTCASMYTRGQMSSGTVPPPVCALGMLYRYRYWCGRQEMALWE